MIIQNYISFFATVSSCKEHLNNRKKDVDGQMSKNIWLMNFSVFYFR